MSLSGSKPMRFGVWLPVYGGWLRTVDQPSAPDVASCLAIAHQAEALGFDFLYASENLLSCIHGPQETFHAAATYQPDRRQEWLGQLARFFACSCPADCDAHAATSC